MRVIFPGTFDPITNGHLDLIQRTAHMFDEIIIAVGTNYKKQTFFSKTQRLDLTKQSVATIKKVIAVEPLDGLLSDFAKNHGASVVIRGLRAVSDFEYELQLANINQHLNSNLETIFLTASAKNALISSSMVKEIASHGGNVRDYVPVCVAAAFKDQIELS